MQNLSSKKNYYYQINLLMKPGISFPTFQLKGRSSVSYIFRSLEGKTYSNKQFFPTFIYAAN
jgi:hypothetical protein